MAKPEVIHKEFARRFSQSCEGNPDVPPLQYGRYGWFVRKLSEQGVEVSIDTIRKWLVGTTRPRPKALTALARILKVDAGWLSEGTTPSPIKAKRVKPSAKKGAVHVVGGLIVMDGGSFAISDHDGSESSVDLEAEIRGARYSIHVAVSTGDPGQEVFLVPIDVPDLVVLGVHRDGFSLRIFDLDPEAIEQGATRSGFHQVPLKNVAWREVKTFKDRI